MPFLDFPGEKYRGGSRLESTSRDQNTNPHDSMGTRREREEWLGHFVTLLVIIVMWYVRSYKI
jgi:hypothetical protein